MVKRGSVLVFLVLVPVIGTPLWLLSECLKADNPQLRQIAQDFFKAALDAVAGAAGVEMVGDLVDVRSYLAKLREEPGEGLRVNAGEAGAVVEEGATHQRADRLPAGPGDLADDGSLLRIDAHGDDGSA